MAAALAAEGSANSPPLAVRAKLMLLKPRVLQYESSDVPANELDVEHVSSDDDWLGQCAMAEPSDVDERNDDGIWDDYDELEEEYWHNRDDKLHHCRHRRSG